ncbi:hypothetical protein NXV13_10080 [Bacteroides ovatus]|nr:hypothetical protein [Bacteroides ovatus]
MKQTRQDFFTANGEGIKIMTFTEFARHILRMECGESLELYAVVNRQTRECSRTALCQKGTMERYALLPARRARAGSPYHQFCGSSERGV